MCSGEIEGEGVRVWCGCSAHLAENGLPRTAKPRHATL